MGKEKEPPFKKEYDEDMARKNKEREEGHVTELYWCGPHKRWEWTCDNADCDYVNHEDSTNCENCGQPRFELTKKIKEEPGIFILGESGNGEEKVSYDRQFIIDTFGPKVVQEGAPEIDAAHQLIVLAAWLDVHDEKSGETNHQVQADIRRMAAGIRILLAVAQPERKVTDFEVNPLRDAGEVIVVPDEEE